MSEIKALAMKKETWGILFKFIFSAVFFIGISDQLDLKMAATPLIVLAALTVYWKFIRHRFM